MATSGPGRGGVVFFDGHCPLCHGTVKFLLGRPAAVNLKFAPLEGETARELLGANAIDRDTVIFVPEGGVVLERSAAAAALLRECGWPWSWLGGALLVLPRAVADWGYRLVARSRYRLGRYETCPLPPAESRGRFLP